MIPDLRIRDKFLLGSTAVVFLISPFVALYLPVRDSAVLLDSARARAEDVAEVMAIGVTTGLQTDQDELVRAALEWAQRDPSLLYVVISDDEGA